MDMLLSFRWSAARFYSLNITKLCSNLPNMYFQRVMIEIFFTVYCHFYGNLLAELLPVFSCKFTRYFLQCTKGVIPGRLSPFSAALMLSQFSLLNLPKIINA